LDFEQSGARRKKGDAKRTSGKSRKKLTATQPAGINLWRGKKERPEPMTSIKRRRTKARRGEEPQSGMTGLEGGPALSCFDSSRELGGGLLDRNRWGNWRGGKEQ